MEITDIPDINGRKFVHVKSSNGNSLKNLPTYLLQASDLDLFHARAHLHVHISVQWLTKTLCYIRSDPATFPKSISQPKATTVSDLEVYSRPSGCPVLLQPIRTGHRPNTPKPILSRMGQAMLARLVFR